ncbi:Minichromosome maintenance protein MCM [Sulfolobus sp. A20]|uniref:minichromosome maintenance protein MCM n=1 Tax=Sulfolobaceae TaxID=118883 RepID=UPI0008461CD8|nr:MULTISPECIES: minichromosome maintenance protein MCM [unclassified Sulfolobus]TRM78296.1 Minichromosome maintenance protein MCM [Sulfolobus sp. A20-N-F8]TRM81716.1 Minichromosome maintenance protein MCM [Sulfolobus sp. D5]TRM99680.1 Minichromosome maintenance protein MCM [Sulfolobus sp. E1]TRN01172.1 Minichromosome maintenance protein MCM [Sulfolobus sp. F1]AOL15736.1 Minichromosome maintenance protein MCM [Sulfolobus sp. A20]
MEIPRQEADYRDLFIEFLTTYKDEKGKIKYKDKINEMIAYRRKSIVINFSDILSFNEKIAEEIINNTKTVIPILENALYDYISQLDPTYQRDIDKVHVRIINIPRVFELRKIRSSEINKLISVEGILVKVTPVKERVYKAIFKHIHPDCMAEFEWPEEGEMPEIVEMPSICPRCGKLGQFRLVPDKTRFVDWQKAVLQERPEDLPSGQLPRQLEIILEDDLVDSARPGDRVKVSGILEIKQDSLVKRGSKSIFDVFMKVNSIEVSQKVLDEVIISEEDEEKIKELSKDPWIRDRIIASIAPSIYGHWEIKEALALALFGGVPKNNPDTRIRGDIHVLVIGDPGTAKSQMLQFVAKVAPRAVYTTGKGSTAAGLTAAVVREKGTGEYYLEAGALVLADGGVAVIDEIDKMREEDRVAIHEAMEQQTVSIAKAGIIAKLNARASVIAAGNPKLGRYISGRPVSDNINLPPTILSRFDLIFILKDQPSEQDKELANYIVDVHSGKVSRNIIEMDLLKKYIAYARKYVSPKITEEAKKLIVDFFVEMRKKSMDSPDSPILITPRQLESLIRLSEAYAKMALKPIVTKEDAERAINIMRLFLESVGVDIESGKIDIDTIMTGKPKSAREKMMKILEIIDSLAGSNDCAKVKDVEKEAQQIGIDKSTVEKLIIDMRKSGIIYESKPECYKKV